MAALELTAVRALPAQMSLLLEPATPAPVAMDTLETPLIHPASTLMAALELTAVRALPAQMSLLLEPATPAPVAMDT
eukprot:COSAG02_NODE_68668_length_231_cov_0.871212_1_plen_76_part_11